MDRNLIPLDEIKSQAEKALLIFTQGHPAEAEESMLELIREAKSDVERYFPYLYYGELLRKMGRWEEARASLTRSMQIALDQKDDLWLTLSHEKLGDLSAAEENWFGARHHYRYALRKAASFLDDFERERMKAKISSATNTLHSAVLSQDPTILSLSREYRSGPVAVSFVHRDIFLKKFFARCLECSFCYDQCCSYGADIDLKNVEKIQQHSEAIKPFIRESEVQWFEAGSTYYEEYVGSQYTRINPLGSRCTFISKDERGCGLHRYAISKGMDYHEIKPLVCILFPLSFGEGILSVSPELDDNSLICSGAGYSAYQSLRNELVHYFGDEFVEELDGIERKVLGES